MSSQATVARSHGASTIDVSYIASAASQEAHLQRSQQCCEVWTFKGNLEHRSWKCSEVLPRGTRHQFSDNCPSRRAHCQNWSNLDDFGHFSDCCRAAPSIPRNASFLLYKSKIWHAPSSLWRTRGKHRTPKSFLILLEELPWLFKYVF